MASVTTVEAKGDKAAILVLDDGSRVWTPDKTKADSLVGKPIPADWTQKQGEYGPQAFPPRDQKGGGGPAAFRNTKEGFLAEQDSMNRRTALMQAVAYIGSHSTHSDAAPVIAIADIYLAWLRHSSLPGVAAATNTGGAGREGLATKPLAGNDNTPAPSPRPSGSSAGEQVVKPGGVETAAACSSCGSIASSTNKPDGSALPKGFLRCRDCGTTEKRAA